MHRVFTSYYSHTDDGFASPISNYSYYTTILFYNKMIFTEIELLFTVCSWLSADQTVCVTVFVGEYGHVCLIKIAQG